MAVFALTQVKGGVGATTLAANLTSLWPHRARILVELGITGGDFARIMGFDTPAVSSPTALVDDGFDFGHLDGAFPNPTFVKFLWITPISARFACG